MGHYFLDTKYVNLVSKVYMHCMPKKSYPFLYSEFTMNTEQDYLDTLYVYASEKVLKIQIITEDSILKCY